MERKPIVQVGGVGQTTGIAAGVVEQVLEGVTKTARPADRGVRVVAMVVSIIRTA